MKKYECNLCGYVYDPAEGDPDNGIAREPPLKICPMIGYARFVVQEKKIFHHCPDFVSVKDRREGCF